MRMDFDKMPLSPAQSAAAILPPHTPGRHEAPSSAVTTLTEVIAAGEESLLEMHSFVCKTCKRLFVARFAGLCDVCLERELESELTQKGGKLTYLKTFPERAKKFIAEGRAGGPSIAKAKALLKLLRSNQGPLIILIGDRGTGKTVMATWWAGMLGFGLYTKAFDFFAAVRKTYHDSKVREHEVLDRYRKADFLVFDEAQERKESDWENMTLTNLVDKRYDALKPTVIITNLKQDALDAALGPSIIRRATETGGIVDCNWKPYVG